MAIDYTKRPAAGARDVLDREYGWGMDRTRGRK